MIQKVFFLVFLILSSTLMANKTVSVTAVVNRADYKDKSIENLQKMAMQKAKLEAASLLFGDFIKSKTIVNNGKLIKDLILAKQGGIVHIEGSPNYENGDNLGELKVSIKAYATDQDIKDMSIQRLELKNFVYTNRDLNLKQLEQAAKDNFLIEAVSQKKPSIKTQQDALKQAKNLALNVKIESMEFNADWLAYRLSGYVEYIPIFLRTGSAKGITSEKILKNKAYLYFSSSSGNYKTFTIKVDKNGFTLNKKILKLLKQETEKHTVTFNIHTKLLIPDSIKTDTVTILANEDYYHGEKYYYNYHSYINDIAISKGSSKSVKVIHENNLRYVNWNIRMKISKNYFSSFMSGVHKYLKDLHYTILNNNDKALPTNIFIFDIPKQSIFHKAKLYFSSSSSKYKTFTVNMDGNGVILNKKILKLLKQETEKHTVTFNIHTKLLVPDSIKTDTVTILANEGYYHGEKYYYNYHSYINDIAISKGSSKSVKVIHENNLRYVNWNIGMKISKNNFDSFESSVHWYLKDLHYIVTDDDDGEKWYALKAMSPKLSKNLQATLKVMNSEKILKTKIFTFNYDTNGIILNKKILKKIQQKSQKNKVELTMTMKLLIPENIKTDTVTILANEGYYHGEKYYYNYHSYINDIAISKGSSKSVKVIHENNLRYVNWNIGMKISKNNFDSFESSVHWYLKDLHYIVTDDDDGEKWYALHVLEE